MKFKLTGIAAALLISGYTTAEEAQNIETIVVEGRYLSTNRSNSIKSPTPILDVPQSLSIFSSDEIIDRGITDIRGIVDYTPGVNTSQGEGHRDSVVFRGVRSTADFYVDGNRDDVQYYRSLYNVEQVEILRGPNALLFGRGGTGGIFNRVSKKAELGENFTDYKTSFDTFDEHSIQIDTNLALSDSSAFRLNAAYENLANHRDFYNGERYGINPTFQFLLSEDTRLDVSYEYIDHERFIDRGIPTGADDEPVERLDDIIFGDPNNNFHEIEAHVFRGAVEHHFTDNVKANVSAFYGTYDKVYSNFYANAYDESTNVVQLDGYVDTTERDNLILSTNLVGEFETGSIGHTLIGGVEYIRTNSDQNRFNPVFNTSGNDRESFLASDPLNFRNLSGVTSGGAPTTAAFTELNDDTRVDLDVYSIYIQDEIEITEQLDVVLGARFDSFDISVLNLEPEIPETRSRKDEEISPRAGIIYKPQEHISIYASYSESFLPRSGEQFTDINGDDDRLDPDTFTNQEIGVKWDFDNGLSLTAAIFENEERSPRTNDDDPATLDVVETEISGFELQLTGPVTESLSISANYSSLEGDFVGDTGPNGRPVPELPENTFSIWTAYEFSSAFGIGLGAIYQDESNITSTNDSKLPSYTRVDASAYYQASEKLRLQLNIENLTDETYFPNAHSTHQVTVGAPINAALSIIGSF